MVGADRQAVNCQLRKKMTAKMHLLLFAVKNLLLNQAKLLVMTLLPLEKDHLRQIGNPQASAHEELVG
jgi:hypothetical protein